MKLFSFGTTIKDPVLKDALRILEDAQKKINGLNKGANQAMHAGHLSNADDETNQMIVNGTGEEITRVIRETGEKLVGFGQGMKVYHTVTQTAQGGKIVNL